MKNLTKIRFISLVVANSLFAETVLNDTTSGNYYMWVKNSNTNDPFTIDNTLTLGLDQTNVLGENSTTIGNSTINYGNYATLLGFGTSNGTFGMTNTNNTIIGSNSAIQGTASFSTVIGSQSTNFANNGIIIGSQSNNDGINSVVIGNSSYTDRANVVSIGNVGSERQIVNVASGTLGTDAVNLNQLQSYSAITLQSSKDYTDLIFSGVTAGTGTTIINNGVDESIIDAKDSVVLQSSRNYTDAKVSSLEQTLTKDIRTATATSIALSVTPQFVDGGKNAIGMGLGNYEGQNAVAINSAFIVAKGQVMQLGASLNAFHQGYKAGYSVSW